MILNILYEDKDLVAIHKPSGLLVHRSPMDKYETHNAKDLLEDQIQSQVYTIHRLDKPTSGVLIFGKNIETARHLSSQFAEKRVTKAYHAMVRGFAPDYKHLDKPLKEDSGGHQIQEAITEFHKVDQTEIQIAIDRYPQSRFSLVKAIPITGRRHQIRRHLRHLNHPIIGDVEHGRSSYNKFFENKYGYRKLLLQCTHMEFDHPKELKRIRIELDLDSDFKFILNDLGFNVISVVCKNQSNP